MVTAWWVTTSTSMAAWRWWWRGDGRWVTTSISDITKGCMDHSIGTHCTPHTWRPNQSNELRHHQSWFSDVGQNPKIWAKLCGYNCRRLLPYAYGQHINVLKHIVYVQDRCRKQFELAVSLNHDAMTSFWLHMWTRTQKSEPSSVGITVEGCYRMPMPAACWC